MERRPLSSLSLFIGFSILWHGLHFLIFNSVFVIVAPPTLSGGDSRIVGVQLVDQRPDLQMMEWNESFATKSRDLPQRNINAPSPVQRPLSPRSPYQLSPDRIDRAMPHKEMKAASAASSPDQIQSIAQGEIVDRVDSPFSLQGEVASRQIISAPPLPDYPEWALLAAVELKLTINLKVNEQGVPYSVFIAKSSGDSQTDLLVLKYTEALRFVPSLSQSEGSIDWEFRLTP